VEYDRAQQKVKKPVDSKKEQILEQGHLRVSGREV
jgi:hypothetical protein